MNLTLFNAVSFIYIFCTALYFCNLFFKTEKIGRAATLTTCVAFALHSAAFLVRWYETYKLGYGHLHIVTLYESLVLVGWAIAGAYLFLEWRIRVKTLGVVVLPVVTAIMIYASLSAVVDESIFPVPEVLQGNFYHYHVVTCFFAYGAFTLSLGASILYIIACRKKQQALPTLFPSAEVLDNIMYKSIAVGFVFFNIQMVTGMFRTQIIWGSYWQWDPTQVFGLLTWLLYATILHGRYMKWWGGTQTAILSILGFITCVLGFLIASGKMLNTGHYPIL
ncbi:MAG: cytochrome c biogenesis protein CcsA [Deltaproteobacteria bacterium]|nr:cytochrome c biogenesis protein CcsA [Deltaproteobacteria bacterium]